MNSSLWLANRMTHIKIVAMALVATSIVVVIGMSARMPEATSAGVWADIPTRTGEPVFVTADTMSKAPGLTVSSSLLARADEVIE